MSRIVDYNHILPSKYGIIPLIYRQLLLRIKGEYHAEIYIYEGL